MSGNPLTDPRAQDLLSADCGEIDAAHRIFVTISNQIGECVGVLGRVASTPTWSGQAADAARSSMDSLEPKLQQIGEAYQQSASALATYYGVVSSVQPQFKALKLALESSAATIASLNSTVSQQDASLKLASSAKSMASDPSRSALKSMNTTISNDQSDLDSTSSQLTSTQGTLTAQQSQGMALLQEFSDARQTAVSSVHDVASQAPKESGWDRFLHGAESIVGDGIHAVEGLGETVFDAVTSLPSDIENVYDHPGGECQRFCVGSVLVG